VVTEAISLWLRAAAWALCSIDTNDISLYANPESSEKYALAQEMYAALKQQGAVNAQTWNGAAGTEQLEWLRGVLAGAQHQGEKVLIFGHMPVYRKNMHNAWNDDALVETFEAYGNTVVAYFNGHNHYGNYGLKNGIHYVNFHGMVELETNAYAVVTVYPDRLEIDGYGREPDRMLAFAHTGAPV
jgi:hypothetical protein